MFTGATRAARAESYRNWHFAPGNGRSVVFDRYVEARSIVKSTLPAATGTSSSRRTRRSTHPQLARRRMCEELKATETHPLRSFPGSAVRRNRDGGFEEIPPTELTKEPEPATKADP